MYTLEKLLFQRARATAANIEKEISQDGTLKTSSHTYVRIFISRRTLERRLFFYLLKLEIYTSPVHSHIEIRKFRTVKF